MKMVSTVLRRLCRHDLQMLMLSWKNYHVFCRQQTLNGFLPRPTHCPNKCSIRDSHEFFNMDRKMGRESELKKKSTFYEDVCRGLDIVRFGIPEYKQEWIDKFSVDADFAVQHGDYEYLAICNGKDSLKNWLVTADSDVGEGFSSAALTVSPSNKGLFYGYLNTEVPKDGRSKKAGFCNLRAPLKKKSFQRTIPYDWSRYTHMYLRIRGDGRNYMLVLSMNRYFDVHWFDMYNFPLFTRGGPYWQIVKVPFSSFYIANSARIQDRQEPLQLNKIKHLSISVGDGVKGPFKLEIDYIALIRDETASPDKDFEYETYKIHPMLR